VRLPSSVTAALRWLGLLALVLASVAVTALQAQPAGREFEEKEVATAVAEVRKDPNLTTDRTIRTLRWKGSDKPQPRPTARPAWLEWVTGFFRWVDESARVMVWLVVAVLAALLAAYIVRTLQSWEGGEKDAGGAFQAPTHVQDLDIRPESLPPNIGAAARLLWDRGEHRAALALLYRGLLSRLAHVHQLPIRDSSTEGDCLALAARMGSPGRDYAGRLIVLWQSAVYGHLQADTTAVHALCDGFSPALDAPAVGGEA
jgi:hypothetical protein